MIKRPIPQENDAYNDTGDATASHCVFRVGGFTVSLPTRIAACHQYAWCANERTTCEYVGPKVLLHRVNECETSTHALLEHMYDTTAGAKRRTTCAMMVETYSHGHLVCTTC